MTIYCYDTEFLEDGLTIDLISIGIVCEDGREYYAINADAAWHRIVRDDWLMKNVVQCLGDFAAFRPKQLIAYEVAEFLLGGKTAPELWAYFSAYDHVALAQLWGKMIDLPTGIPMRSNDVRQEMERLDVPSDAVPQSGALHNALEDARWNWDMLRELRRRTGRAAAHAVGDRGMRAAAVHLEAARYGKHSIYNAVTRAKQEGTLTPELRNWIIDVKKYLR